MFLYFSIVIVALLFIRFIDRIYQRFLMNKFLQNGRKLSPISKRIVERWQHDYSKLSELIKKIDTKKLNPDDKKNLATCVNALNFFYQSMEPIIGTGVRRYKIRISNTLRRVSKLIIEFSNKANAVA